MELTREQYKLELTHKQYIQKLQFLTQIDIIKKHIPPIAQASITNILNSLEISTNKDVEEFKKEIDYWINTLKWSQETILKNSK